MPGAGLIEYARQLLSVVYSSPSLNLLETHIKLTVGLSTVFLTCVTIEERGFE